MASGDLEQVVALDARTGGLTRNDFFQRRWQAMEAGPQSYIGLVAAERGAIKGFALGHILTGEFGTRRRLAIIDSIAVSQEARGSGVGAALMEALKAEARARDCSEIRTLADWSQQDLLRYFAKSGFSPAPLNVLEKSLEEHRRDIPHER
jgi:N-acetylglutamate synthase-like GNAT family acetyltransferase